MANKTYRYEVRWAWKEEGNRVATESWRGQATTVPRAISKMVRELNADLAEEEKIRTSDLLIIDCRVADRRS